MPAATITSLTAHGGTVILGFPQVLIGMMPASRITDMHVCPMVTVLVPHVGGPFVLGSMTVLTGMMPQSRVTDMLVCVGPPDTCVMGVETVLVGMAGAGGAGGAAAGISAMGASVPMAPPATQSSPQPTAEMQADGTIKTSAPPGGALPPIPLSSPGFPDLPASQTPNFTSAQPVTIPPNTTLYRVIDPSSNPNGSYWAPDLPPSLDAWRQSLAVKPEWNSDGLLAVAQTGPDGLKAWMGPAASQGDLLGGATQLFVPPGSLNPSVFQAPWSGVASQAQQAAQQAAQGAQQMANQATQAAAGAASQAQQAAADAEKGAQQAATQAAQQAQGMANQAQQAAQQAQQQGQQAVQQAQQGVQQAQQQAQQAAAQGKAAAQQAVTQAQQTEQQVQQQAQQATQQAQQAAQQAQQAAQQAAKSAQQAGQQAGQAAQQAGQAAQQATQGLPKGF
jgi:uncharacterized Zn-binding protein involved in type VI secretion